MPSLKSITENLAHAEREFLIAADVVSAGQWRTKPSEERWSAGEVVCHLIVVERTVIEGADKLLQSPPRPRPFLKRFHVPMALVETRLIRRKSPIPIIPELVGNKEEMLAQLRAVREHTLSFMEETRGKDLSKYHRSHPFLGTLNIYEWFQMIASHELRHTKQMREISATLPKCGTTLQK